MALKDVVLSGIPKSLDFTVELPSRGQLYQGYDPKVGVKVTPITFQDELDMVSKRNEKNFNPVDFLLSRKMTGLDMDDLLSMDKFAILLKLREISYGNEYKIATNCPHCNEENILVFSLKDLRVNELPVGFKDPREINLPVSNVKAQVRFPRQADFNYIGETANIADHLWRFVVSVNGEEDKAEITELLADSRFPLRDAKYIVDEVLGLDYGIQTLVSYECNNDNCKKVSESRFTLNADFFTFNS